MAATTTEETATKKATKKSTQKPGESIMGPLVCGIHRDMTVREVLVENSGLTEETAASLPTEALIQLVTRKVLRDWPKDSKDLTQCVQCKSISNKEYDNCLFCGSEDTVNEILSEKVIDDFKAACEAGVAASVGDQPTPAREAAKGEDTMGPSTHTAPAGGKKNGTAKAEESTPNLLAGGLPPGAKPAATSTALAKAEPKALAKPQTEDDLDNAIAKFEKLKAGAMVSIWDLGDYLRNEIYETQLWKQRTEEVEEKGGTTKKPGRWKTWESFCNSELQCVPATAMNWMLIAKTFTRDDVARWGPTKLGILATAPKEELDRVKKSMEGGASVRQLLGEVSDAKKKHPGKGGRTLGVSRGKYGGEASDAQKEARKANLQKNANAAKSRALKEAEKTPREAKITVAAMIGKLGRMKFYRTDAVAAKAKDKKLVATKMDHNPVGIIELPFQKGMHLVIKLKSVGSDGGWCGDAEFKRIEEEE